MSFKLLKIRAFQETVCYKKPFSFKTAETYPLPPYSTIIGFFHKILETKEFINMVPSVQGLFEDKFINLQTFYFYKCRNKEITQMPLTVHTLYNVNLVIHLFAEYKILDEIIRKLLNSNETFSLGRWEDLLRIDEIKLIDAEFKDCSEGMILKNSAYIPLEYDLDIFGINYNIIFKYIKKNKIRDWEKVRVKYVESGQEIFSENLLIDSEGDLVWLAKKI